MESRVRNSLWSFLRADAKEARRARRRLVFGIAFSVFLGGLLMAAGLAVVVLGTSLFIVVLIGSTSAVRAFRRNRHQLQRYVRMIVTRASRASRRSAHDAKRAFHAVLRIVNVGVAHAQRVRGSVTRRVAGGLAISRHRPRLPRARHIDVQHEALRLNVAGTKHRRSGEHAKAIELHRRALEILSDTEDLHAVALTQNNLALAMSHVGDDPAATVLFEQAAATLRELGDQEREGRIMANLALAHRRHGRVRECEDVLRLALTKLHHDSSAHRRVEAELSRVA